MIKLKPSIKETKLVLGDYMTVHLPIVKAKQTHTPAPRKIQMKHEELYRRVLKERKDLQKVLAA